MDSKKSRVVVGKKQILRELKNANITEIRIAEDVEAEYAESIKAEARRHNVGYVIRGTMRQLADEYGVDVPTGAVGTLADEQ